MTYDARCLTLARVFLEDEWHIAKGRAHELAQVIQEAIEAWLEEAKDDPASDDEPEMEDDDE